jgi:type IV fimbrial biogenesis protein FimT
MLVSSNARSSQGPRAHIIAYADLPLRGFTLTEMAIVMAIVAILLAIAIPSYRNITTAYRISSEFNGLVGDLQFARAEALKEGNAVTVCVSNDATRCSGGTNWAAGWIVFSDPNANAEVDADAGERILRVQNAFAGPNADTFTSAVVSSFTFNREGFTRTAVGLGNTSLVLADASGLPTYTTCLSVSAVGMLTASNHVSSPASCP